jgi:aminoglycoside/choline kinase family phosphotransferase
MNASPDIRRADRIDAEWMTQVLGNCGIEARVARVEARPVGTGQTGECTRFQLEYQGHAGEAPQSLIGKFPSSNPASFSVAMASGDYAREVKFYGDLAATALVATPQCYCADIDEGTGEFVLLLEDLAPAEQGDQLAGVTPDQARLVVDEAAKLHGSHWNDPAIAELDWIKLAPRWTGSLPSADSLRQLADPFCERFAGRLSERGVAVSRRYAERVARYRSLPRKFKCLAHYDFRPDNMMFATPAGGRPVTVVDWQTLSYAAGADDLAFFLAGALPAEVRRQHEPELLERYLGALRALGVTDYEMEDLRRDYALGGFRLLATAMGGSMAVKQTKRGDRMFMQMANAAAEFIDDHNALAYLD